MSRAVKCPASEEPPADEPTRRRQPVQARSRETVERILQAANALVEEGGLDAVTTRAIAERAGITAPSLYRFFADRDQVLDALMEQHLERLSAFLVEAEKGWTPDSVPEFVERELDTFAAYFQTRRNVARLWFDGRVSPTVRAEVLRYHRRTAERLHCVAAAAGFATSRTDPQIFVLAVELGDRILDLAFRGRDEPDPDVIRHGRTALTAYLTVALEL